MAAKTKASQPKSSAPKSIVPLTDIEKLMELMGRHGYGELEWESNEGRIHLRRDGGVMKPAHAAQAPISSHATPTATAATPTKAETIPANQKKVLSPFVGTFYRAASPTAEPYAKEGGRIKRGSVLCIIEAMKLMNEIESEFDGKIVKVLVENGQPVEFGEPLFLVET